MLYDKIFGKYSDLMKKRRFHPEAEPLPENASVLEIEEYEKRKNQIDVNIYDGPARYAFVQSILAFAASVALILWVTLKPILYYGAVPGYDGLVFMVNTVGFVLRGLFTVAVIFWLFYILKLYKESVESDASYALKRKTALVLSCVSFAAQPVIIIMTIVQAVGYYSNF